MSNVQFLQQFKFIQVANIQYGPNINGYYSRLNPETITRGCNSWNGRNDIWFILGANT